MYFSVNGVLAIHTGCVLEVTYPQNERLSGFSLVVCWSSLTAIMLYIFLAGRKDNVVLCMSRSQAHLLGHNCLNEDGTVCHLRKPNRGVSVKMVLLRLIVSLSTVIWLTSVPIAMTLVRAVTQKWPFMLMSQVCPSLESSLVEKLDCKGNVKLCDVPMGIKVLIWLGLTATNLTSLSTVSKCVYIWYMFGYMCCKEDCSSDSLTWFIWLGTNFKFCEYSYCHMS